MAHVPISAKEVEARVFAATRTLQAGRATVAAPTIFYLSDYATPNRRGMASANVTAINALFTTVSAAAGVIVVDDWFHVNGRLNVPVFSSIQGIIGVGSERCGFLGSDGTTTPGVGLTMQSQFGFAVSGFSFINDATARETVDASSAILFHFVSCFDIWANDLLAKKGAGAGYMMDNCSRVTFSNCTAETTGADGFMHVSGCRNVYNVNCTADNTYDDGFSCISYDGGGYVQNITFVNPTVIRQGSGRGISLIGRNILVQNPTIINPAGWGLYILVERLSDGAGWDLRGLQNVIVTGGIISGAGTVHGASLGDGAVIYGLTGNDAIGQPLTASEVHIIGTTITDSARYGIRRFTTYSPGFTQTAIMSNNTAGDLSEPA